MKEVVVEPKCVVSDDGERRQVRWHKLEDLNEQMANIHSKDLGKVKGLFLMWQEQRTWASR